MYSWRDLRKHWYLMAVTAAILAATLALVWMQYRSVKRTQEQTQKTMRANLQLHLFEITEEAKRAILDHASHILHGIHQQRVRNRKLALIEQSFSRLSSLYPEVEDFYVIFIERESDAATWQALKFLRGNEQDGPKHRGFPLGKLVEDVDASASLQRAWRSINDKGNQPALYTSYDPETTRQYFFHTVYQLERHQQNKPLENIGVLVFSAQPAQFPAPNYLPKLVAKHQGRGKEIDGLLGKMEYRVALTQGAETRDLVNTNPDVSATLSRRFDESDRLFPSMTFAIFSPDIAAKSMAQEFLQASILLGLGAALVVIIGLLLTWRAVQRERKVAQLKSDFLASISHELKTPLTAIRAFGDLLHSGRVRNAERIHEYGGLIKTESDRLTTLINNILELSRLERGVRRYRLEDGTLCAAVAETVEVFRHSVESQGFTIAVTLPTPPVQASFDASALRQALLNLLSNAARYAGTSRHIEVTVEREQADAVIAVRDFGIGIAAAEQRRIFTPFYRAAQTTDRGLGIGLAIVREIIQAHGGEISVESEPGAGATFRLRLPLLLAKEETAPQTIAPLPLSESN